GAAATGAPSVAPSPSLPRKRGRKSPAAAGEIDLMVIGAATYADWFFGLLEAETLIGRRIGVRIVRAVERLGLGIALFAPVAVRSGVSAFSGGRRFGGGERKPAASDWASHPLPVPPPQAGEGTLWRGLRAS